MTGSFSTTDLIHTVSRLAEAAQGFSSELNDADARLGDGDLGITVSNGWRAAAEKLRTEAPQDIGRAFVVCAKAFQETSASSFGTLTATGLMAVARVTMGRGELPISQVQQLVQAAAEAMAKRGKAQFGDKTVLDSLDAIGSTAAVDDPSECRTACARAAAEIAEHFRSKPNKIGRARMFGDNSIGVVDPGMLAVQRMAESI